jgi:hypothetical protein
MVFAPTSSPKSLKDAVDCFFPKREDTEARIGSAPIRASTAVKISRHHFHIVNASPMSAA